MPRKTRKITETDRAFYKLGLQEGENRLKRTLELLKTTNARLWDELCRLDEAEPREGVLLSFKTINQVIRNAKTGTVNPCLAHKLEKIRGEARKEYNLLSPKPKL